MAITAYFTIGILALTFALHIKTMLPPTVIFLGALTLSMALRIAPLKDSLKGFFNSGGGTSLNIFSFSNFVPYFQAVGYSGRGATISIMNTIINS